jgi:anti-anti-sigma regulatory factor
VVALTGHVNLLTAMQVQRVLLKDLSERPYAIICDLTGVEGIDPACATVFSTVANHPATSWPTTNFLLSGARPAVAAVLRRVGLPQFLPLHETVEDALDQVAAIPPYLRHELQPPATATAPSAARRYVRDLLHLAVHDADPRHLHLVPADPRPTTAWSGSSGWPPPGGPPAARRRQDRLVHPTPVTPAPRSGAP